MAYDLNDDLAARLHAARPRAARAEDYAPDHALLARVREQPVAPQRKLPRGLAVPVVAGVTLATTAVVMLAGGPGDLGGPSPSAAAITQALHWLTPAQGTVLHARSVETRNGESTVRELWQSADHPELRRMTTTQDGRAFETSPDGLYDPATDTIYRADGLDPGPPKDGRMPAADPMVIKVRTLLQDGQMEVTGPEQHDGADAWAISPKPALSERKWTLWVSTEDGKPLELRDPGDGGQVIRWPTYEVVPEASAQTPLTLEAAHPSAHVVDDRAQVDAAEARLLGMKSEDLGAKPAATGDKPVAAG
jgi:hypothetical protein